MPFASRSSASSRRLGRIVGPVVEGGAFAFGEGAPNSVEVPTAVS